MFSPTPRTLGYKNNWNHVEAYFQLHAIANGTAQADGHVREVPHLAVSPVDQSMWIDNLAVGTAPPQ